MSILFVDLSNWNEHIANCFADCKNETEMKLWNMHLQIPSSEWKLGKTLANRIN